MTDIKELALRVAKETDEVTHSMDEFIPEFAQRFLAAYLAEQKPVAWVSDCKTATFWQEVPPGTKLFTVPPLPESAPQQDSLKESSSPEHTSSTARDSRPAVCAAPSSEEVLIIASRLRVIANAIADANYNELTMRIPAEPDRDADIVTMRAAALIERLAARVPDGCVVVPMKATAEIRTALRVSGRRDWPSDELCNVRWAAAIAVGEVKPT